MEEKITDFKILIVFGHRKRIRTESYRSKSFECRAGRRSTGTYNPAAILASPSKWRSLERFFTVNKYKQANDSAHEYVRVSI